MNPEIKELLESRRNRWVAVEPTPQVDWREYASRQEERRTLPHNHPVLDRFAEEVEDRYGLPPGILVAIKNAGEMTPLEDGRWKVSPKGASGVMQFMPRSIEAFPHDASDPFANIDAAGKLLVEKIKESQGNIWAAVALYNGGWAARTAVLNNQEPPALETQAYLRYVKTYMQEFYQPRLGARILERQQRREQNGERTGGNARPSTSERGRGNSGNEGLTEANSPSVDGASEVGGSP